MMHYAERTTISNVRLSFVKINIAYIRQNIQVYFMSVEMLSLFIAGSEWIWVIGAAAILIFGAKKIPQMARSLGRAGKEFEKGKLEGVQEVNDMIGSDETLKLQKSAELLGIDTEGMTKDTIKESITKAMAKKDI